MEQLELLFEEDLPERKYKIPGMTENPAEDGGMLRKFLANFHKDNGMPLPPGFWVKNKKKLLGMYYGMERDGYFRR